MPVLREAAHRGNYLLPVNREPFTVYESSAEHQSNSELTLCSACVYLIALLSNSPTERMVSFSN